MRPAFPTTRRFMTSLDLFGFGSVLFMLFCYTMEARAAGWTLAFAVGCISSSIYGFLQGAWPFGAAELLWATIAVRRWWARRRFAPVA